MDSASGSATVTGGEPPRPHPAALVRRPRLCAASLVHALAFGAAATFLPWRVAGAFALTTGVMALLHGVVAVAAGLPASWLRGIWRSTAWASWAYVLGWGWAVGSSAQYLSELYGSLGQGVGLALMAAATPVLLFTVPFGLWGLAATRHEHMQSRERLLVLLVAGTGAATMLGRSRARAAAVLREDVDAAHEGIAAALGTARRVAANARASDLSPVGAALGPARCDVDWARALDEAPAVAIVVEGERAPLCFVAESSNAIAERIEARGRRRRAPVAVDVVTNVTRLNPPNAIVAALALRPGLDGVCGGGRCLAPWQLVGLNVFGENTPLPFIPDLRVGVDLDAIRERLDVDAGAPLWRIETASRVVDRVGRVRPHGRSGAPRRLRPETFHRAFAAAERHVLAAQREGGEFRYALQAITGRQRAGNSIARQAGTLMVLCELGAESPGVNRAVRRAVTALDKRLVESDGLAFAAHTRGSKQVKLGPTALTMAALQRCASRLGPALKARVATRVDGLHRFVLAMQRDDGGFAGIWHRGRGPRIDLPERLYGAGQAALALAITAADPDAPATRRDEAVRALDRHTRWVVDEYWDHPTSGLFFIEENWHCLAARELVDTEARHDGYERFCLNYVRHKRRLQLDEASAVDEDLRGGHGFGNLIPPHSTATAGYAEAVAAAVAIADARGETRVAAALREALAGALRNLVRQQWDATRCHACRRPDLTIGGFSESLSSPIMRIDFTQHAWAAMGHGAAVLGVLDS